MGKIGISKHQQSKQMNEFYLTNAHRFKWNASPLSYTQPFMSTLQCRSFKIGYKYFYIKILHRHTKTDMELWWFETNCDD